MIYRSRHRQFETVLKKQKAREGKTPPPPRPKPRKNSRTFALLAQMDLQ